MFDIGFQELMLVMVVALLVIGPERMPGVARKAGLWFGKARRFIGSVKDDIDREFASDELKRIIQEQKDSIGVHEIIEDTKEAIEDAKQEYMLKNADSIKQEVKSLETSVDNIDKNDKSGK
ncbi:MAG: twin-arginine translocase subunit TatB [Gammaproteobacteria bacterium]|nr:twin-arginine translocase subunit TatB [Gammaproteobacteria bacterium]